MRMKRVIVLSVLAAVAMGGCSMLESKKIDYKSAGKLPSLEIPPDLTSPGADNRYAVPDVSPQGTATFSVYNKELSRKVQGPADLLPDQAKVKVERAGTQRWLVVNAAPGEVWPVVKEFWQELGFILKIEMPEAGVMETDWAENRAKIPQDPIRNVLSKVADGLYSTSERDKFRTRLERAGTNSTEVYISHRGMYEVIQGGDGGKQTIWEPRPADPELEAEMLRRLMVRFGVEETRSQAMLTATTQERAKIERNDAGNNLSLYDPFDRAWRRVGLALDRIGFTVEDRDRSKGLYFVRYADPETDGKKDDKGFLSKLAFWRSEDGKLKPAQFRIEVAQKGEGSQIRVFNQDGSAAPVETANKILNLLHEQLK